MKALLTLHAPPWFAILIRGGCSRAMAISLLVGWLATRASSDRSPPAQIADYFVLRKTNLVSMICTRAKEYMNIYAV